MATSKEAHELPFGHPDGPQARGKPGRQGSGGGGGAGPHPGGGVGRLGDSTVAYQLHTSCIPSCIPSCILPFAGISQLHTVLVPSMAILN